MFFYDQNYELANFLCFFTGYKILRKKCVLRINVKLRKLKLFIVHIKNDVILYTIYRD